MKENKLKEKLINGHSVIGPFCKISSTSLVEISALAGFDFVILDVSRFAIFGVENMWILLCEKRVFFVTGLYIYK